jgi:hypothetical protein
MRRQGIALAVVSALALMPVGAPAASQSRPHRCANVSYDAGGGYYYYVSTKIRAKGLRCSLARRIAHVPPEDLIGRGSEPRRFRRFGFVCRGRKHGRSVPFTCKRKRAVITFTWTEK